MDAGISRGKDVVIVDTAGGFTPVDADGRDEEINRGIGKAPRGSAARDTLVLDGTIGRTRSAGETFAEAIPITGLVVTKVDGTAKGGIVLAVHEA